MGASCVQVAGAWVPARIMAKNGTVGYSSGKMAMESRSDRWQSGVCSGDGDGVGIFPCFFFSPFEQDAHPDGEDDETDAIAEPESGCAGDSVGYPRRGKTKGEGIAATQSDAPQCQDIKQCRLKNDFVGSQHIRTGELDSIEKQQTAQERKEQ